MNSVREQFLDARWAFVERFCAIQGWNHDDLSWGQIQTLRAHPEWQSPPIVADSETFDCGYSVTTCEVCEGIEDVRMWDAPGANIPVCAGCYASTRFRYFLVRELTRAMVLNDDEELMPDGKWHNRNATYPRREQ